MLHVYFSIKTNLKIISHQKAGWCGWLKKTRFDLYYSFKGDNFGLAILRGSVGCVEGIGEFFV